MVYRTYNPQHDNFSRIVNS